MSEEQEEKKEMVEEKEAMEEAEETLEDVVEENESPEEESESKPEIEAKAEPEEAEKAESAPEEATEADASELAAEPQEPAPKEEPLPADEPEAEPEPQPEAETKAEAETEKEAEPEPVKEEPKPKKERKKKEKTASAKLSDAPKAEHEDEFMQMMREEEEEKKAAMGTPEEEEEKAAIEKASSEEEEISLIAKKPKKPKKKYGRASREAETPEELIEESTEPKIYALRTTANREDQVVDFLTSNASRKKLAVYSVVRPHGMRGYIFIEAATRTDAEQAAFEVPYAKGLLPSMIQYKEIEHMLEQVKKEANIQKNDIAEIISGPFKREKCKITRIDRTKEEVVVELLEAAVPIPLTLKMDAVRVIRRDTEGQPED